MRTVTADQLSDAIRDVLDEYGDDVSKTTVECVKEVAKQGVKALRANSPRGTTGGKRHGKYARNWTSQVEDRRVYAVATIYNKTPGLPHLLEYGHVSRNGTGRTFGSVGGRPHIKAVEETLIRDYTNNLTQELSQ